MTRRDKLFLATMHISPGDDSRDEVKRLRWLLAEMTGSRDMWFRLFVLAAFLCATLASALFVLERSLR